MDTNDVIEACMKTIQAKFENLNTLNIVVCGKSGVGKSTLVNAIFREDLAETGIGQPVTQSMKKYTKQGVPLAIYDTKGFELGKDAQEGVKNELLKLISDGIASRDICQEIHCIWYCVNSTSNRFESEEIQWIKEFTKENAKYHTPVIIVLTQAFSKKHAQEMKDKIENENLRVLQVIPVLAKDYEMDDDRPPIKAYGMDKLIEVMQQALPEELLDTLANVQQVNLEMKLKKAHAAVVAGAAAASVAGVAPIPFSDAALLVPIEVSMMASITVVFGLDIDKATLTCIVSTVFGSGGATIAGKTIVANLMKLIPGVGSVVGGAISGTTAAALTTALGEAYIGVMTAMYHGELKKKDIESKGGQAKLIRLFKKNLKKNKGLNYKDYMTLLHGN